MSKKGKWSRSLAFVIALLLAPLAIMAQSDTSSLSGTITDLSGAVVPGAKITIYAPATHNSKEAVSNESGSYTVTNLAPGVYEVQVEATGFQTAKFSAVQLDPNIGRRIDVTMKVGQTSDTITVEAGVNVVQTENASVGQLITAEQVKNIQLNGRNPLYLSQMEPGVVRSNSMAALGFALDNGINVSGARNQESLITFDGAPMVRTRSNGTSVGVADVDSTSQVQVLTTSYQAEYGRSSGGQIRIVPKSGTSTFHGSAFEFVRNKMFNANPWSRNHSNLPRQSFNYNQFGWNLNGPVTIPGHFNQNRDKLFFLAGEEWIRYIHDDLALQKVPTALMRQGDFSELLGPNMFYSSPKQLVDPNTGTPIPNNKINLYNPGMLSSNGIGLLNEYPVANNTTDPAHNWVDSAPYSEHQRKDSLVIDYAPADAHHFRFSMLRYAYNDYEPHNGNYNRVPRIFNRPNQIGVVHYAWTINPTTVNDLYVSGAADHVNIGVDTAIGLYDRTKYGINYPYVFGSTNKVLPNKIPTVNLANIGTLDGTPYPSRSGGIVYTYGDTLTKIIGNHTLKFGAQFEYSGENNFDQISVDNTRPGATNNQNGQFVFTDTRAGSPKTSNVAVANAALGLFDTYGEIGTRSYTLFRGKMYEGFAQDLWHATSKFVVEAGLRYSINNPYYTLWGNQSFFSEKDYDPTKAPTVGLSTGYLTGGTPLNGMVIPGNQFPSAAKGHVPDAILNNGYSSLFRGYSSSYSPTVYTNFQPRLGFVYQIKNGTVIRAGVGRYVQRLGISDSVQVGGNAPFQPATTISVGNVDNPAGSNNNVTPTAITDHAYKYPSPEAWGWNLTAEHEFPQFATLTLSYVGRRGYHLEQMANVNQLQPGTIQAAKAAHPGVTINADALRPYLGYSTILENQNAGGSFYHSMQANLKRRLSKGVLFGAAYTWSKSIDYGSANGTNTVNAYNYALMRGPSDYDTRHVLVMNYLWDIPYATHSTNRLVRTTLGGWHFSGTIQFQSGRPQSVSQNNDVAGVGPGSGNQYWVVTRKPNLTHGFGTGQWYEGKGSTIWSTAPQGTFAPAGYRGMIYGPGFQSYNAALEKDFNIIPGHDNHQVKFRAEAFNFPNHPNWDNPDNGPTSGTFGQINSKGGTYASDRQFQFSLRYAF